MLQRESEEIHSLVTEEVVVTVCMREVDEVEIVVTEAFVVELCVVEVDEVEVIVGNTFAFGFEVDECVTGVLLGLEVVMKID